MTNRTRRIYFAVYFIFSVLLFLASMAIVKAQTKEYTSTSYHIVDIPDVLPALEESRLADHIQDAQTKSNLRIWVFIDDFLVGTSIDAYSQKMFDSLFQHGNSYDNGVLVVAMTGSRKVAIRTGPKAKVAVTDAECKAVIRRVADILAVRKDDWSTAVNTAVWDVIDAAEKNQPAVVSETKATDWPTLFFISAIVIAALKLIFCFFFRISDCSSVVHPEATHRPSRRSISPSEGSPTWEVVRSKDGPPSSNPRGDKSEGGTKWPSHVLIKQPAKPVRSTASAHDLANPLNPLSPLSPLSPFNPINQSSADDDDSRRSSISYDSSSSSFTDSGSCGGASGDV